MSEGLRTERSSWGDRASASFRSSGLFFWPRGTPTLFPAFCLVGRAFPGEEGVQGEGQKSPRLNVFPTPVSWEQSREFPTLGNIARPRFPCSRQPWLPDSLLESSWKPSTGNFNMDEPLRT